MPCFYLKENNQRLMNATIKQNEAQSRTTVRFNKSITTCIRLFDGIISQLTQTQLLFTLNAWNVLRLAIRNLQLLTIISRT